MPWIHARYQVEDFNKWKQVYDTTAEYKRHQGWKRYRLYTVQGNRTDLIVMEEFVTLEQAQAFIGSDFLRDSMRKAGVVGMPEVLILQGLEEGMA